MLLTIDIGGTSVKTALWDAGNLSLKKKALLHQIAGKA